MTVLHGSDEEGDRRPAHWLSFPTPGMVERRWSDGTHVTYRHPSIDFEAGRSAALFLGRIAADQAAEVLEVLRSRMLETNPLQFFLCMDALQRMLRRSAVDTAQGYDVLVEFVGGILTSLPSEQVMRARGVSLGEDDFTEMELLVREFARLDANARIADLAQDADERNWDARALLVGEQQFDRMSGYTQHLDVIAADVLERLDGAVATVIGFAPRDALRAARACATAQEASLFGAAERRASRGVPSKPPPGHVYDVLSGIATATSVDPLPTLVHAVGLEDDTARRLLDALSTPLASQNVSSLTSPNRLRQFPVIRFEDGTYLWPSPHDFVHDALDWADLHLADRRKEPARNRLLKARSGVAESLVSSAFTRIFGRERVHSNVEYQESTGEWIETDLLIDLGVAAIVVEVKSHRITTPARQADAARVRSKVGEFLRRPLEQTDRARSALMAGCQLRDARGKWIRTLRPQRVRRVIVHLDRVDPFVTYAHEIAGEVAADAWIVCAADLLATTELLTTPAELYGYIGSRAGQIAAGSPLVFMESDALGAWLKSREGAWPPRDGSVFQLAYSSAEINTYFTQGELHGRHPDLVPDPVRPGSGIPTLVLETMSQLIGDDNWPAAADLIASIPPQEWRAFKRDLRRVTRPVQSRHQRRNLASAERGTSYGSDRRLLVRILGDAPSSIRSDGDGGIILTICTNEVDSQA